MRGRRHRSLGARVGAVLATVVALAGCGGSSQSGSSDSTQTRAALATQTALPARSAADALQQEFVDVVKAVEPEVVQIQTNTGLGSGIVFNDRGDVVTNAHVVTGAQKLMVTLATGRQYPATLVGIDPQSDIAVIRISGATPGPATFADSSRIQVGDIVLAVGNPLGLRSSVTQGIVSSVGRTVSEGNGVVLPSVIQTSAEINPGNSGGALVDLQGDVVGIPTLAAVNPESPGGAQAAGIGFAISSNTAKSIATNLIQSGSVATAGRAYLGVVVSSGVAGGVLVVNVQPGGPAAKAGIKPGDVIVAVAGQSIDTTDVLVNVLAGLRPGQTVPVEILAPSGRQSTVQVTLGRQPRR